MISRIAQAVFIHIPKTGGNSVDHFFLDRGLILDGDDMWHATAAQVKAKLGDWLYDSYFSFSIVRNPWDRMVSQYFWQGATDYTHQISTPWGNKTISFEDFIKSDFSWFTEKQINNGHLREQVGFIFDNNGEQLVDEVIRFENLQESFAKITERLRFHQHATLPHLNRTNHQHYSTYYTADLAQRVANMWPNDVTRLGYSFL